MSKVKILQSLTFKIWTGRLKQCSRISSCSLMSRDDFLRRVLTPINSSFPCALSTSVALSNETKAQNNFQASKDAMVDFAEKINWSPSSDELLINAFTHKSFVTSTSDTLASSFGQNERLIYLGHQTASSFIAEILYFKYPSLTAEQLWDLQNGLLHNDFLEECGRKLKLHDLIFSKDEICGQIVAETLLAIIGSLYIDQPPNIVHEFIESYLVPELTDKVIKEICQFQHPKFMLHQLNPAVNLTAKILEKQSWTNIYGDEMETYKVGIFQEDKMVSEGEGDSLLKAEKNACQNLLKKRHLDDLKKAMFPLEYDEYMSEDEIDLGLFFQGTRFVAIEKGEKGFGFSLKGGEMRCEENKEFLKHYFYFPPFVSSVVEGGPAQRCGLKAGDVILAIDDESTNGMSHGKVVKLLHSLKGDVKFTVKFSKKVLITDDIERRFGQFKERKLISQLKDPNWSKWHQSHTKHDRKEYETLLKKRQEKSALPE